MNNNLYTEDILSQPDVLEEALSSLQLESLKPVKKLLANGEIDRVIITGMGASFYGVYPAWLLLSQAGLPAFWVDLAELYYHARGLVTPRTLLWVVSQSGRSAELMHFFDPALVIKPRLILALTNDLTSPLAQAASVTIPINAPPELTVSTRTYLNTLAISQLAALELTGRSDRDELNNLLHVAANLRAYFRDWQTHVDSLIRGVGLPRSLVILGRGVSLAAAQTGALIQGEASKFPALALNAAEFRHGLLEMIRPDLVFLVLAGAEPTLALNRRLAVEIDRIGGKVFWLSSQPESSLPVIPMPVGKGSGLPIAEIAPLQLLSLAVAQQSGINAGEFYYSGKVTLTE